MSIYNAPNPRTLSESSGQEVIQELAQDGHCVSVKRTGFDIHAVRVSV